MLHRGKRWRPVGQKAESLGHKFLWPGDTYAIVLKDALVYDVDL